MRKRVRLAGVTLAVLLAGCAAGTAPGQPTSRTTNPPWPAPRDGLAQIQAAGLEASRLDDTTNQRRFTLTIAIDAQPVSLVPYIGMDRPRALQGPAHTHDESGTVWLEGRGADTVTLGEFFTLWGVRFDDECLGAACGGVTVTMDGERVKDPRSLRLAEVAERLQIEAQTS